VEAADPQVVIRAGVLILQVANTPAARLSTSKVLYTLSKDKNNDALFRCEGLMVPAVELIQAANRRPADVGLDTLVYCLGALKNMTSADTANQRALAKAGGVQATCQLLQTLVAVSRKAAASAASAEDGAKSKMSGIASGAAQVAVQASGLLRNLAVSSAHVKLFREGGLVSAVSAALGCWTSHVEVCLNVVRVTAKLSLLPEFGADMTAHASFIPAMVRVLVSHMDERAVVLRAAFVLGNLTTDSQEARAATAAVGRADGASRGGGAVKTLVGLLEKYVAEPSAPPSKSASKRASAEEVLVKLLRLLANLAMHPDTGPVVAAHSGVATSLAALLQRHNLADAEELLLNAVSLLTNVSFYSTDTNAVLHGPNGTAGAIFAKELLKHVTPLLLCDNEEAVVEAARVYGNFSRIPEICEFMLETRVVEALTLLLDHPNLEVLYAVAGSLVNLTTDPRYRDALVAANGCRGLLDVLERCVAALYAAEGGGDNVSPDNIASTSASTGAGAGESANVDVAASAASALQIGSVCDLAVVACKALCNIIVVGTAAAWSAADVEAASDMLDAVVEAAAAQAAVRQSGLDEVARNLQAVLQAVPVAAAATATGGSGTYLEPL